MSNAALPEIIVYGTVCLDRFLRVDESGEPLPGESARTLPGGEAFNTATMLAGWDVAVLLTGTAIGGDAEGDALRALLDSGPAGLSREFIPSDPEAVTPVCDIRVSPDGERRMSGRGFAHAVPPPPLPMSLLEKQPVFVTDPNLGAAAIAACRAAARAGCPIVSMDFAHVPEVVALSRVALTSREVLARRNETAAAPDTVAARLCSEYGAQTAIVTLGADGCVAADSEQAVIYQPAIPPPAPVVDTTGAGDAFRAGIAFGLLRALPLREMLRFASASAALHCTVMGGGSRFPLSQVKNLAAVS